MNSFKKIQDEIEKVLNDLIGVHNFSEYDIKRIASFAAALAQSSRDTREEFFRQILNTSLETIKKLNSKTKIIMDGLSEEEIKKLLQGVKEKIKEGIDDGGDKKDKKKILN